MLIIPVKKYIGSEKKMGNFETGLILLAALLLFGGASHILASDLAVSTALLFGSLALLSWGLVKGLRLVGEGEKTTNPSTPGDIGPVTFGGFSRADDKFPWCVATKYAIAYEVNGVPSDMSAGTPTIPSSTSTMTDPILTVDRPPSGVNVKWYRATNPNLNTWVDHTQFMSPFGNGTSNTLDFMDTANPCESPYIPNPPPAPLPAGNVGENMFTAVAGAGVVPWCIATRYFARYARNGQESVSSLPSPYFYSNNFTFPRLSVPEQAGLTINWYREVGPECETYITLPVILQFGAPTFYTTFRFSFGANLFFARFVDFGLHFGNTSILLCLEDFVKVWNESPPLSGSTGTGGLLRISGGKLIMDPIVVPGAAQPITFNNNVTPTWWTVMGFNDTGLQTNTTINAERGPNNQLVSANAPIGTGPIFTDMQNPCQVPNPPTSAPAFDRFNFQF
jgi:hypothetical protein